MLPLWRRAASGRNRPGFANSPKLTLEALEAREVPAVSLVSGASGGSGTANNTSLAPHAGSISDDGNYVVYLSTATNLVSNQTDTNAKNDAFLFDKSSGTTKLLSRQNGTSSTAANGEAFVPYVSGDGKWVGFFSNATNLISGLTIPSSSYQLYLYDQVNDSLRLVSYKHNSTTTGVSNSDIPQVGQLALSDDGKHVAYINDTYDLVANYTTSETFFTGAGFLPVDAYLYTRTETSASSPSGTNTLVSRTASSATTGGNDFTTLINISGDGSTVVFSSPATNLVTSQSDSTSTLDIFRYNVSTGAVSLVTHSPTSTTTAVGFVSDQDFFPASVSDDGKFIAYASKSATLVTNQSDASGTLTANYDAFIYDVVNSTNKLVSHTSSSSTTAAGASYALLAGNRPLISGNGQWVVFNSTGTNLVSSPSVSGAAERVYLYKVSDGSLTLVSRSVSSTSTAVSGISPTISNDGRYVTYVSTPTAADVYLYDRSDGSVKLISHTTASTTTASGGGNALPIVSGDGKAIAWNSTATNLVSNDNNAKADVFLSVISDTTTPSAPTGLQLTTFVVPLANDTTIGQFVVTAEGSGRTFQYALVPGTGSTNNSLFVVDNATGTLKTSQNFVSNVGSLTSFSIRVQVTDANFPTVTQQFVINNLSLTPAPPQVQIPTQLVLNEGGTAALNLSALAVTPGSTVTVVASNVPAGVTFSAGTNLGNGVWTFTQSQLSGLTLSAVDNTSFTMAITATAAFPSGGTPSSVSGSIPVVVQNVAPVVTVVAPATFNPLNPVQVQVNVSDPGLDVIQAVVVNWGDGKVETFTAPGVYTHQYAVSDDKYQIGVSVKDEDGTFTTAIAAVVDAEFATPQQSVVAELYLDLLGRDADVGGLMNFSAQLAAGVPMKQVITAFISSPEYAQKVVNDLYLRYLGRPADPAGLAGYVQLYATGGERAVAASILASPEFFAKSGGTNEGFLAALYLAVFDRPIDPTGRDQFLAQLAFGVPRLQVAQQVLASAEGQSQVVEEAYEDFLDREPDAGLQGWIPLAVTNPNLFLVEFLSTEEYATRLVAQ